MVETADLGRGAVVVTGASTGIGRACALRLDREGFAVFAGVRREADAGALRSEASPRLRPLILDVTEQRQVDDAARTVEQATGPMGVAGVVNNAGVGIPGPLEYLGLDRVRRQLEVNTTGQLAVTQALLPAIRRGRGRIVFMSSTTGYLAAPFIGAYSMSKHALEAMADALRVELRPWGIQVSVIEPGVIATAIWAKGHDEANDVFEGMPEEAQRRYRGALDAMLRRTAEYERTGVEPERVADAVLKALTARKPKTRYIVGRDARMQFIMRRALPDRMRDRLIARYIGLPQHAPE